MKEPAREVPRICVLGTGSLGRALVHEMARRSWKVIAVDRDERVLEEVKGAASRCVAAEFTEPEVIESLHPASFDAIFLTPGRELTPALTPALALALAIAAALPAEVIPRLHCRLIDERHRDLLERIGVLQILEIETLAAKEICDTITKLTD